MQIKRNWDSLTLENCRKNYYRVEISLSSNRKKNSCVNHKVSASLNLQRSYLISKSFHSWNKSLVNWSPSSIHSSIKSSICRIEISCDSWHHSRASLLENLSRKRKACISQIVKINSKRNNCRKTNNSKITYWSSWTRDYYNTLTALRSRSY
jgi:hypothetical protein